MRLNKTLLSSIIVAFALSSCGALESESDDKAPEAFLGNGTFMGVVRDAETGERIALESGNKEKGVFVLMGGTRLVSNSHMSLAQAEDEENANPKLVGEFFINGIHTDSEFPFLVNVEGYKPVEGRIYINSTVAQRTGSSEVEDLKIAMPIMVADIVLHPEGKETQSVTLLAIDDETSEPLDRVRFTAKAATSEINLARGRGESHPNGYVTQSTNIREPIISGYTDDNGEFEISGERLALDVTYNVEVTPTRNNQVVAENQDLSFIVLPRTIEYGLNGPEDASQISLKKIKIRRKKQVVNTDITDTTTNN